MIHVAYYVAVNIHIGQICGDIVLRTFTQQEWVKNFRMCKENFLYICSKLAPTLRRSDTVLRKSLSVEGQVAVTLWCLATPTEYWTFAHLFSSARSTMCEIVHETCHCIVDVLMKDYLMQTDLIVWLMNSK